MEIQELYQDFTRRLEVLFGSFDREHKRFGGASNSDISRELGYSDAQFSRLINESATEGEYQRAIQNAERLIKLGKLEKKVKISDAGRHWYAHPIWLALFIISSVTAIAFALFYPVENEKTDVPRDHMLQWAFNSNFVNPYTNLDQLPDDCDFPCYRYQGKWKLKDPYKLPFFMEKSGFHYLATEVTMYARCMVEGSETGDIVEGFEYQKHEIWYDTRELPMDSFMLDPTALKLDPEYLSLDFNQEEHYVKIANVHTFFRNQFQLDSAIIHRTGKVIGRDLEFIPVEELVRQGIDESKATQISSELNNISTSRLRDFSNPIQCEDILPPQADFHRIMEGDLMEFHCQLTTSRVGLDYTKTYELADQHIKNSCQ